MAKRATVFDEETARILVTIARLYKQTGFVTGMGRGISALLEDPPVPYYVHNDSGEEIPPYACMQVTGTEEIGGQNYLLVDKPADTTGDAGSFLFNNHRAIADNEEGIAQFGPVVRAFKNTGTVTAGEHWLPVANQWYIAQDDGGPFVAAGADDIDDDVLKVFTNTPGSGGGENIKIAYAASGIAARSATFVYAGSCTEYKITGTGTTRTLATNTATFDVFNLDLKAIPAGTFFIAEQEHITGVWIAKHPAIINLRLSGNNLQYTYDNDTWTTWHTGTTC